MTKLAVAPSARLKLDQFRGLIRIKALRDTWQDRRASGHAIPAAARKGQTG
ncbi:MAG: hypothetical protein PHN85_05850 [Kiritimatiellae bacterium]|nr:hypothetical protein [Kiritimatiellia bacterium]